MRAASDLPPARLGVSSATQRPAVACSAIAYGFIASSAAARPMCRDGGADAKVLTRFPVAAWTSILLAFRRADGAHAVYLGAGTVLRCPAGNHIALVATALPDRHVVHLTGTWRLDMPRP